MKRRVAPRRKPAIVRRRVDQLVRQGLELGRAERQARAEYEKGILSGGAVLVVDPRTGTLEPIPGRSLNGQGGNHGTRMKKGGA
jgi:hypothetical protein